MNDVTNAAKLPRTFVAFVIGRQRPFKYVDKVDAWDVYTWDGSWQFFDNVGNNTALLTYNEALIAYNLVSDPERSDKPVHVEPASSCVDVTISGAAGSGKSAMAFAILDSLRSHGIKALIDPVGEDDVPGVVRQTMSKRLQAVADSHTPVLIRTKTTKLSSSR